MTSYPKCDDCIHFLKSTKQVWPHICKRSHTSTLWERAMTLKGSAHHDRNCGPSAQHKQTHAKAIPDSLMRALS